MTADNTTNNDTLTNTLAEVLTEFQGSFSCTRCSLHILNIVTKAILKQFDVKEVKDPQALADEDVCKLTELAQELESEERTTQGELQSDKMGVDGCLNDIDDESWVEEVETMDEEEMDQYEHEICPIKMVLVKVRCSRAHFCMVTD